MFDIIELNGKKVAELREIASKLGITRVDKLKKQDLVYSILDEQAAQPNANKSKAKSDANESAPKKRAPRGKSQGGGACSACARSLSKGPGGKQRPRDAGIR